MMVGHHLLSMYTMKSIVTLGLLAASQATATLELRGQSQTVLREPRKHIDLGHFSEWSRATKKEFLIDWEAGKASDWTIVQGNEAGGLDSMSAALTWAYHLVHKTANSSAPVKAIALLQTPSQALRLRPENQLALDNSQMTPGHEDILTLDELPEDAETLSKKLKGIVLVDHGDPSASGVKRRSCPSLTITTIEMPRLMLSHESSRRLRAVRQL